MTDELTSEQEAAVRRLLAEARHDAPVPPDVAARLDDVLEGLAADEGVDDLEVFDSPTPASVTELAGVRRRRRNAGRLLLAAAAVLVGGVAAGQVLSGADLDAGSADDAGGDAGGALASPPRETADRVEEEAAGDDGDATADSPTAATSGQASLFDQVQTPLDLTSANFATDVQRELLRTSADRRLAAKLQYDGVTAFATSNKDFVCADGPYGEGARLPAYYDAEEAVLVLRRPRLGLQRADLLTCGTADTLNSVELPAP